MAVRMLIPWHLVMGLAFLWGSCCTGSSTFRAASTIGGLAALLQGNLDCCDEDGHTMLGKAAAEGCLAALNFLLVRGAQPDVPSGGLTPLMWASRNGHTEVMKELLCAGARVDAHDEQGRTALMMASEQRRIEAVRMLLKAKAKPNFCKSDWTPLICAASGGCATVLKMLLQAGAEVNAVTQRGRSALLCAIQAEHISFAEALLVAGAEPDRLDMDSGTPLTSAVASSGALDAVRLLLRAGANANFARADGSSALLLAVKEGKSCVVQELLAAGADSNNSNNEGDIPLISALKRRHTEVAKLLLDTGADVNIFDGSGWTPLACVVHYQQLKLVEYLLKKGADPNLRHVSGPSPLDCIIKGWCGSRDEDISRTPSLLVQYGAHIHKRIYGSSQNLNVIKALFLLVQYGAHIHKDIYGSSQNLNIMNALLAKDHSSGRYRRCFLISKKLLDIVRVRRLGEESRGYWCNLRDFFDRPTERPEDLEELKDVLLSGFCYPSIVLRQAIDLKSIAGINLALQYRASRNAPYNEHKSYGFMLYNNRIYRIFIKTSRSPLMYALHQGCWESAKLLIDFGASPAYQVFCPQRPADLYCVYCFEDPPHSCRLCEYCHGENSFERAAYVFDVVDDAVALALQEYKAQHCFFGMWWQVPKPGRGFEILRFLAVRNLLTFEQRKRLCSLADCNTEKATLRRIGPRVICDSRGQYSDWTMNDVQDYTTWLFAGISQRLEGWYRERYTPFEDVLPQDLVGLVKEFDALDCMYD